MFKVVVTALCALTLLAPLAAQAGEVHHRETRQEHRIYQGVKSGDVSRGEYAHLQSEEYRLNAQRERDLRAGRPGLNRAQYVRLNREESRLSHQIYRAKHNGRP